MSDVVAERNAECLENFKITRTRDFDKFFRERPLREENDAGRINVVFLKLHALQMFFHM